MTNPTPHGQVPDTLIDLIDAYAETRHRCGGVYNAKTEAARKAVIEALSEVQAPKAAPGEPSAHQILAITTAYEQGVGKGHQAYISGKETANPYDSTYRCDLAWQYGYGEGKEQAQRATKAAPPAEQQAQPGAVYAELPAPTASIGTDDAWHEAAMRDFADRTHALRMQAAPKAAPQQEAQPNYVVSLVVVKEIPTGVNTQNKLYTVNAASADEAVGKAVLQMPSDFPEHRLHTACFVAAPAQPAPAPLSAREIELLDGMIDAQLNHAQRCDSIPNRPMAEKQKGWDMERVTLLRKLKATMGGQQA